MEIENKIKDQFTKGGLFYKKIKKDGIIYMYAVFNNKDQIAIDVFKAYLQTPNIYCKKPYYKVPKTSSWGISAWSYAMFGKEKAEKKYQELIENEIIKATK